MPDVRPSSPQTWPAYEAMMERHNGVFGGCRCLGFHSRTWLGKPFEDKRALKRAMVEAGTTRAALESQKTAASFLSSGTLGLFERAGFTPIRKIGLHRRVVRREIAPA